MLIWFTLPNDQRASTMATLVAATLVGGGIGWLWWTAYDPRPLPLALLVAAHVAVALAAAAAAARWVPRWFNPGSLALALVLAAAVAPAALASFYRSGWVYGPLALAADLVVMTAAALLGAACGRALLRGPRRLAAGSVVLVVLALPLATRVAVAPDTANSGRLGLAVAPRPFADATVALIGLDGADWRIIDPLLADGRLPNLRGLIMGGRHGVLRSIAPMHSPVLWTTIFTGQPREVHGLRSWYSSDARNRRSAALWDIVGASGLPTLTVNVPGTWPPLPPPQGAMISGFPMPGISPIVKHPDAGLVLSTADESGPLDTIRLRKISGQHFAAAAYLEAPLWEPNAGGFSHVLLDVARQRFASISRLEVEFEVELVDGRPVLSSAAMDAPLVLPFSGLGPWFKVSVGGVTALFRVAVLEAKPDRIRLYLSAPSRPAWDSALALARGLPAAAHDPLDPYICEATGLILVGDHRAAAYYPEIQFDAESGRAALVRRALSQLKPAAVAYVLTVTDRLQHAYLKYHEAGESPTPLRLPPELAGRDPIVAVYEHVDRLLGELTSSLPPNALVMVVSDHGFAPPLVEGAAKHRVEGIWIAHGPMIPPAAGRSEMSVLDVLPTLLRCLGAPLADDFPGRPFDALCPGVPIPSTVASYTVHRGEQATQHVIDPSREQQLRNLGYVQ